MRRDTAVAFVMGLIIAQSTVDPATAASPSQRVFADQFGLRLTDFCDLSDHSPISDKCFAFVAGVVEMMDGEERARGPNEARRFCPRGDDINQMILAIRPALRFRQEHYWCAGLCTAAGDVAVQLYRAFPCAGGRP